MEVGLEGDGALGVDALEGSASEKDINTENFISGTSNCLIIPNIYLHLTTVRCLLDYDTFQMGRFFYAANNPRMV